MTTLLYTHPACLDHDPGHYHPESPARLRAVLEALDAPEFAGLERREAPEAEIDDIARVHPRRFVERVLAAVPSSGHVSIDADTVLSPGSGRAALRAAGARDAWPCPCRGHRFRRPSRQWHAGTIRRRSEPLLRLDPSVPALSRHRQGERDRGWQHR